MTEGRDWVLRCVGMAAAAASCAVAGVVVPAAPAGAAGSSGALGDSITVGLGSLPTSQGNPFGATYAGPAAQTWSAIFDALTNVTPSKGATPALATSWTQTNPTTWEFTLRQGVTFSDGEPFNAAAVASTVDYLTSPAGAATAIGGSFQQLAGATAVNDSTVDITTKVADPILPRELVQMNIVAPQAWQQEGPAGFALKPVGTGPYEVTSWGPTSVSLTRFANSWRPGHYKDLTITQIPDQTSRYQALQSGQLQVDYDLSLEQLTSISSQRNLKLTTTPSGKVLALQFVQKPGSPIMKAGVRLAMTEAINRKQIVSGLFGKLTTTANQGSSPGTTGFNPKLKSIPYNPKAARKLLAKAGYPHGFSIEADVTVGSLPGDSETFQAVAANLKAIGIAANFVSLPYATWLSDFLSGKFPGEMTSIAYSGAPAFDALLPLQRGSCLQKPVAMWCVQSQASLLSQAANENNVKQRTALLQQVQASERTNPPALFILNIVNSVASSTSVKVGYEPIGTLNFATLAPAS